MKRNIKSALITSLESEEKSVADRFDRAEAILSKKFEPKPQTARPTASSTLTEKVIRDTFTIPEGDHKLIKEVKLRCMKAGVEVSKSELIRAGLKLLFEASDEQLIETVEKLERLKVGRKSAPKKV